MSSSARSDRALKAAADVLRVHDRFLLVTHENPDGDALGSLLGVKLALDALGKDSVMFLGGEMELPREYAFMVLDGLSRTLPDDAESRVVIALDCANAARTRLPDELIEHAPQALNFDHHHDNTRFARINVVVPDASSTGEIVRDLLHELDVPLTSEIAEALYIAVVTDTGRFQYTNTTPKALRLAAELVEAGVDVHRVFQGIYESVDLAKLKLLARALERARVLEGGRMIVSHLVIADFAELNVGEEYAEGIIDYLRAVDGAELAATIREPPEPPGAPRRISMRASTDVVDVSAIARKRGGGGHRQAAGFSSEESVDEIIEFIRSEFVGAVAGTRAQT
jgi:phosphoesterase RecJ-like protein